MSQKHTRVALVTGAAGGLGRGIVDRLLRDGCTVVATDLPDSLAAYASERHGTAGLAFDPADLTSEDAIRALVARTAEQYGSVDVLVNNAGVHLAPSPGVAFPIADTPTEAWLKELEINLTAPFLLSKAVIPFMEAQGWGRIVNVLSRAGRTLASNVSVGYAASKAGLWAFTRNLADDGGPSGITANAVAPGGRIPTAISGEMDEASLQRYLAAVPVRREGSPEDVAAAISFLVSDEASYITGVCIDVAGGLYMA